MNTPHYIVRIALNLATDPSNEAEAEFARNGLTMFSRDIYAIPELILDAYKKWGKVGEISYTISSPWDGMPEGVYKEGKRTVIS